MTTLPPSVTESRHIPHTRDSAKLSSSDSSQSRPVTSALAAAKSISASHRGGVRRTSKRDRYTAADLDDDMALAKSRVRMPRDDHSQNTSRAAATAASARTPNVHTETADSIAEKAQIAALHNAGLLYEDASPRDRPRLTLDNISHDEPSYVIRPAKPRARKHGSTGSAAALNLSYLDLGDDESLIKYGMALSMSEADAADVSSTLTSPALRAIQEMGDASSEGWVMLDNANA